MLSLHKDINCLLKDVAIKLHRDEEIKKLYINKPDY